MAAREPSHTGQRKLDHLRINLSEDVTAKGVTTGFEHFRFVHQALPEINLADVDTSQYLFGRRLDAPLLISSMTGGVPAAAGLNQILAAAAQELGLAMGVGSQRVAIEEPDRAHWFEVRRTAPDILLFANVGAVQLNYGFTPEHCRRAVEMVEADALVLHLNPLQEAVQPGGNTNFAGLVRRIAEVCRALPVPVIVKEVGWGISLDAARMLCDAGVSAIDVAGAGGTSWSEVEKHRAKSERGRNVAAAFAGWGIPTAASLLQARQVAPELPLIASGGMRDGIDVAKAIALGASAVGVAGPALRAAARSAEALDAFLHEIIDALRIAMFCIGAQSLHTLRDTPHLVDADSRPSHPARYPEPAGLQYPG